MRNSRIDAQAAGVNGSESAMTITSVASVAAHEGWPELPEAALHGLAGEVVRTVAPHSEADPAAILVQFLVAAGNAIGPGLHCAVESTRHAMNLFACLVGETSKARKGTSWEHVMRICSKPYPVWAGRCVTTGLSTAEGLIAEVAHNQAASKEGRLLLVQSEFASVLRILQRGGNTLSPILRAAWDNGNLRSIVKKQPLSATGAHISLVGHISCWELLRYLSQIEAHNGFANRVLWVCVRRSGCLPEGGRVPDQEIAAIAQRLSSVRQWARHMGNHEMKRDRKAGELWTKVYPGLSEGQPGLVGAVTGRAEAQVLRLAALYAVVDCSDKVRTEHLIAALGLWTYCSASAQYIFGESTGRSVADRIHEGLENAGAEGLSRTQVRDLFGRHKSSRLIDEAIRELESSGLVASREERTGGRTRTTWIATRAKSSKGGR
jgi:hypothetical protein